jgi:hypothetical protein
MADGFREGKVGGESVGGEVQFGQGFETSQVNLEYRR